MLQVMNLSPQIPENAAKISPLTFSMEHLLHRLYGVDAPDKVYNSHAVAHSEGNCAMPL